MITIEDIRRSVSSAIDTVNRRLGEAYAIGKSPDTRLFDEDGPLDSLEMLNLLAAIEERLSEDHAVEIDFLLDDVLGPEFRTVGSLTEHALTLVLRAEAEA